MHGTNIKLFMQRLAMHGANIKLKYLMKFNETKMGRVKFVLPETENVEVSLLWHVTACSLADRSEGFVNYLSFDSRQWEGVLRSDILEGPN
jgi:hypothetical protein